MKGSGILDQDPGPGGQPNVLAYTLPFAGTQGDVLLLSQEDQVNDESPIVSDVIRFNGNSTLIFYSDNVDGFDSPADTPSPPSDTYDNSISITEVGPEGDNGALYTPTEGQPGWDPSGPTYHFISDVPEPGSLALLATGGMPLLS